MLFFDCQQSVEKKLFSLDFCIIKSLYLYKINNQV